MAMLKQTVEISGRGYHLAGRTRQLQIKQDGELVGSVPFEDLGILVLDTTGATVTTAALTQAAEAGAFTLLCGQNHLPIAIVQPLSANALSTQRLIAQTQLSKPIKGALWARVIASKINGQARFLPPDSPDRTRLLHLAKTVKTGDKANHEAQAAQIYWRVVFSKHVDLFRRRREFPGPNAMLNYGYAIMRAAMARALCVAGLQPGLGINHTNRSNPFCLADDFLEPFRPVIDHCVAGLLGEGVLDLGSASKPRLLETLTEEVACSNESGPASVVMQRIADGFASLVLAEGRSEKRYDVGAPPPRAKAARRASTLALPWLD